MINNNKISTKFEIAKTELKGKFKMKIDSYKSETYSSIDMKISTHTSNKYPPYYDWSLNDIIKWTLLKSPENYSLASQ